MVSDRIEESGKLRLLEERIKRFLKPELKEIEEIKFEQEKARAENELNGRVNAALEILTHIIGYSLKLAYFDGVIVAKHYDGVVNYTVKILDMEDEKPEPCVTVSCEALGRGRLRFKYKSKWTSKSLPVAIADLFEWVVAAVNDRPVPGHVTLSNDDVKADIPGWEPRAEGGMQPGKAFKDLIAEYFPGRDTDCYYRVDSKNQIVAVDPLKILCDLDEIDVVFERRMRRLIKLMAMKWADSDEKLRRFFMNGEDEDAGCDDKDSDGASGSLEEADEDGDEEDFSVEDLDYGSGYCNSLMNECLIFGKEKAESELISDEKEILDYVVKILKAKGYKDATACIDGNGVIRYTIKDGIVKNGFVGQVFLSETKLIKTKFRVQKTNYWFVPGYRAHLERKTEDEKRSLEERTKLTGYVRTLKKLIFLRITSDLFISEKSSSIGSTVSLNRVYRKLYEARFDYDFLDEDKERIKCHNALPLEVRKLIVETFSRKVRYDDYFCESTVSMDALISPEAEKENEYFLNGESIYLIDGTKGCFDPEATSTGKEQGCSRYLVEGASVNPDGTIRKSEDANDRTPVFKHGFLSEFSKYNPYDRNQMVFSNLMRAYAITEPAGTALMTCGGWNMEDAFAVSKEFAESNQVPVHDETGNPTGEFRPLKVGDKMLDRGGNKGVISIIVDPKENDSDDKLSKLRQIFNDNPGLQVIASPYSGLSRFNGATARELMKEPQEIKGGTEGIRCIGKAQYIITRQFADKKTRIYDHVDGFGRSDYEKGRSRQASAQLSWALCSKDAREMLRCLYKDSLRSETDMNDVLSLASAVSSPSGRRAITFDSIKSNEKDDDRKKKEHKIEELLKLENGASVEMKFDNGSLDVKILSTRLRPAFKDFAGRLVESEITRKYREVLRFTTKTKAKEAYRSIQKELSRRLYGKDNIFKTRLMTRSTMFSATAIWTPDPGLPIESIAISEDIANRLEVNEGDYLLIWRDPVLRDSNVRYMKVERIDNDLTGIAVNPVMAKGFDGDFDGDTVAVVKISYDRRAHEEAIEKFSVEHNLLDEGRADKPLCINTKLDLISTGKAAELEQIRKDLVENKTDSKVTLKKINEVLRSAFDEDYLLDNAVVRVGSDAEVKDSFDKMLKSKAKSSDEENLKRYVLYFNGGSAQADMEKVQKATAIKSAVGIAGRYSQQLMWALREVCPKAVLELTYPNTQALLQIKHEPDKAVAVYGLLKKDLMDAWNMNQAGRAEKIRELYEKLDQPIGREKGIDEKYLMEVDCAMGDKPLAECRGDYLDTLAYQNDLSAWRNKDGWELTEFFAEKCSKDKFINDSDFLLDAIARNSEVIRCMSNSLLSDDKIVLAAIAKNRLALRHLGNSRIQGLLSDGEEAKAEIEDYLKSEELLPCRLKNKKEVVLAAVRNDGMALQHASPGMRGEPEVVLAAVMSDGMALKHASPKCKDTFKIVKTAVIHDEMAIDYASPRLKEKESIRKIIESKSAEEKWTNHPYRPLKKERPGENEKDFWEDRDKVLEAVGNDGKLLIHAARFKNDEDVVIAAVSNYGEALEWASRTLKNEPGVVEPAIANTGRAFQHASGRLRNLREYALIAVRTYGQALEFTSYKNKMDEELVLVAVKNDGLALHYAPELQDNETIVEAAVKQNGMALEFASPRLKDDETTVKAAIDQEGRALRFASPRLQDDESIVLAAVSRDGTALKFASPRLQNTESIVLAAVRRDGMALQYAEDMIKNDNGDLITDVPDSELKLKNASDEEKQDRNFVLTAVSKCGSELKYAGKRFQNDREIVLAAVTNDGSALMYASDNLKNDANVVLTAVENDYRAIKYSCEKRYSDNFIYDAVQASRMI